MTISFDSVGDAIMDHPYLFGGLAVVVLFLTTRGGDSEPSGGINYAATLDSLRMTTEANVALSQTAMQRDIAIAGINKDFALGELAYKANKDNLNLQSSLASIESARNAADATSFNALTAFQSVLGYRTQEKSLENQARSLNQNYDLGIRSLNLSDMLSQRESVLESKMLDIQSVFGIKELESQTQLGLQSMTHEENLANITLPFQERMFNRQKASEENLYWRMKQIAKNSGMMNLFSGLIGTVGNVASTAIAKGA